MYRSIGVFWLGQKEEIYIQQKEEISWFMLHDITLVNMDTPPARIRFHSIG